MLITAKPTQFQLRLPFPPSTKRTTFNPRRTIILNNNNEDTSNNNTASSYPPMRIKKNLHRKLYPGETIGITEEMRFIAMRLRNDTVFTPETTSTVQDDKDRVPDMWHPSMEGFIRFLVDNQLLFATLERIVDDSDNVSVVYFRKTRLERSEGIKKDLEWLKEDGAEIPNPSSPGITYAKYLEELAERSTPLFLSHFYNIHFSHISAGQVITKQVSEKLLEGKELEFCKWEGDVQELLKDVREKLNVLSEHWPRDVKKKCLAETRKSFRFLEQIVRLIIL
ncbi:probable inactive heme oxygenase 2, chloroplastic [Vicia villosa]|uniref:probable inactive heme oxygenase 2, chloroplastic n=1 Tax=Vicia villosa TaxID=3911 RepID=UPI00273C323E|nr:probable inactive heme oxygenase 2, chloroplastic [Vicia villosa]